MKYDRESCNFGEPAPAVARGKTLLERIDQLEDDNTTLTDRIQILEEKLSRLMSMVGFDG